MLSVWNYFLPAFAIVKFALIYSKTKDDAGNYFELQKISKCPKKLFKPALLIHQPKYAIIWLNTTSVECLTVSFFHLVLKALFRFVYLAYAHISMH